MQKARYVRIVYRDSYLTSLGRLMRNRLVLASLVLIVLGVAMFAFSMQQGEVVDSKFIQNGSAHVTNSEYSSIYFGEPPNLNSTLTITMPLSESVQYKIYGVDNYTRNNKPETTLVFIKGGMASNGTQIQINSVLVSIGQEYVVMLKSATGDSFNLHSQAVANIFLVEPANRNIGGPGVMLLLAGTVLLAARVSAVYRQVKQI